MKKSFLFFAMAAAVLASCVKPTEEPSASKIDIKAEVSAVSMHAFSVDVTVNPGDTYFIGKFDADVIGITAESIVADLASRVESGEAGWADFLHAKSETFTYSNLESKASFKVLVFGVRGDGTISSDVITLKVTTEDYQLALEVSELLPFQVKLNVTTNTDELGWFACSFNYKERLTKPEKVKAELMEYLSYICWGKEYEDIVDFGNQELLAECSPEHKIVVAVIGINRDLSAVGDAVFEIIEPPYQDITILNEGSNNHIYTALYDYNNTSFGSIFQITEGAPHGYVKAFMDFNGMGKQVYGTAMYDLSEEELGAAMAKAMQADLDANLNMYGEYFVGASGEDVMEAFFYPVDDYYEEGKLWSPTNVEDIVEYSGKMPGKCLSAMGVFMADNNWKVYPVAIAYARYDYSSIDYSAAIATASAQTMGIQLTLPAPAAASIIPGISAEGLAPAARVLTPAAASIIPGVLSEGLAPAARVLTPAKPFLK